VAGWIGQQERAGGQTVVGLLLRRLRSMAVARIAQDGHGLGVAQNHHVTRLCAVDRAARAAYLLIKAVRVLNELVGGHVEGQLPHQKVDKRIGCFHQASPVVPLIFEETREEQCRDTPGALW
jgi:hypothetical protein